MRRSASEMAARASTRRSMKIGIPQDTPAWATKSSEEAEPFGTQMFFLSWESICQRVLLCPCCVLGWTMIRYARKSNEKEAS